VDTTLIERKFESIGARARVEELPDPFRAPRRRVSIGAARPFRIDVESRGGGESFLLQVQRGSIEVEVVDADAADRHLLLMVREGEAKSKFLCGHDERHWFVAAIPEDAGASTVASAKEALKPREVRVRQTGLKARDRNRRKNEAYVRQGEWFFVPAPEIEAKVTPAMVLKDEPLFRAINGRVGKHHVMEEAVRFGGETVYVRRGEVLTHGAFIRLDESRRKLYTRQVRNPELYCRGTVRHADHKTVRLRGWHRVFVNTETRASAAVRVDFLD
jgi:hypothetical protein